MEIFSQHASETLSSPEQLDQLMRITDPRSWIALVATGLVLAAAVAWGVFGSLPTSVTAQGVIIRQGGTFKVMAFGNGQISELTTLKSGDLIHKGQILGRIMQPALAQQIEAAQEDLQRLTKRDKSETNFVQLGSLQGQGLRSEQSRIAQAANRLNELQLKSGLTPMIVSDRDGSVVEVMAANGDVVSGMTPILSAEIGQRKLEAIIYLPANTNAELIKPGMTAQIALVTSKKERFGYLVGKVLSISKYPASEQGMMATLNHAGLVREFSRTGPPIAVLVELLPDAATRSGYTWSSAAGAGVDFHSGTLCAGTFIIERRRPISLIIPLLQETVGL